MSMSLSLSLSMSMSMSMSLSMSDVFDRITNMMLSWSHSYLFFPLDLGYLTFFVRNHCVTCVAFFFANLVDSVLFASK